MVTSRLALISENNFTGTISHTPDYTQPIDVFYQMMMADLNICPGPSQLGNLNLVLHRRFMEEIFRILCFFSIIVMGLEEISIMEKYYRECLERATGIAKQLEDEDDVSNKYLNFLDREEESLKLMLSRNWEHEQNVNTLLELRSFTPEGD